MTTSDTSIGVSGDEPELKPPPAPPLTLEFMSSVMARLAHREEVQKTTNEQLAALVAALSAPTGQTSNPHPFRRHLFNTNPVTLAEVRTSDEPEAP